MHASMPTPSRGVTTTGMTVVEGNVGISGPLRSPGPCFEPDNLEILGVEWRRRQASSNFDEDYVVGVSAVSSSSVVFLPFART